MDSSDDECEPTSFESYKTKPEWRDIEPISIRTTSSIMEIKYTPKFEETFGYFRAMLTKNEISERSLGLTSDCIAIQPSNFSVWYFRRKILKELTHHMENELKYVTTVISLEPKNYQVWHHRRAIVEWLKDASEEKEFTAFILKMDCKNYHAWQHRAWAVKEFQLWSGELEFTEMQLDLDLRNNSSWNHRYFVTQNTKKHDDPLWLENEIKFVMSKIYLCSSNESSWSYLRGILKLVHSGISKDTVIEKFCENLYQNEDCRSSHLLAFMVDAIWEKLTDCDNRQALLAKAVALCDDLQKNDKIRSNYWRFIKQRFEE